MKILIAIISILILSKSSFSQNKIYFESKKISDLNINTGNMFGVEEFRPDFPFIWKDFSPNNENYIFSGYYSISANSESDNKILNGEIKLIRYQICVAEGTLNIKEDLTFNFKDGQMQGPVNYSRFSTECNGETNEKEYKNLKWKKDLNISANYSSSLGYYQNINYNETRDWDKTKLSISQFKGYDISLDYFDTIIHINTCAPNEKPVFKKVKF